MNSPVTNFLAQLTTPEFQTAIGEQLRAEAAAANTFLSYRDEQGRYVHEYPATGEVYEVSLTQPQTRRLLLDAVGV
ncbi:hypothetical protein FY528_05095 [Hymenobacter lutimineralis]|uniref:Uncharacterized protein n=1 Tax=Hymenobacter lutimineralis TaxID=2606448 RepID=A0A5D6VD60_9BACT|nr:hypothetical protein [Hymenobacter lutimineralis]TYZ12668.1 hypothetical protein FY528_05095 [Hymenobacter lutimineralis]